MQQYFWQVLTRTGPTAPSEQYLFQPYLQVIEFHSLQLEYLLEENAIL